MAAADGRSGGDLEQLSDEAGLGPHVAPADAPNLPLPDHRHGLVARQRPSRRPEAAEAEPGSDQAFHAPVVLLHDVVEELGLPYPGEAPKLDVPVVRHRLQPRSGAGLGSESAMTSEGHCIPSPTGCSGLSVPRCGARPCSTPSTARERPSGLPRGGTGAPSRRAASWTARAQSCGTILCSRRRRFPTALPAARRRAGSATPPNRRPMRQGPSPR